MGPGPGLTPTPQKICNCLLTRPATKVQSRMAAIFLNRKRGEMFKTKKLRPAALPDSDQYTSTDVARICGVSLRQLQWWDERSVVSPRQDGHKRVYLAQEVLEVSVIAELRRKGFSLQKIRRVLRFLQKDMGKTPERRPEERIGDASADRRQIHLSGRGAGPDHRFAEECPPADVSGVRQRPGAAAVASHEEAGPFRGGPARSQGARRLG